MLWVLVAIVLILWPLGLICSVGGALIHLDEEEDDEDDEDDEEHTVRGGAAR